MSSETIHAGDLPASPKIYIVTEAHNHEELKNGDAVIMVETPDLTNLLLRLSDMTLHRLMGQYDQYVHLSRPDKTVFVNVIQ